MKVGLCSCGFCKPGSSEEIALKNAPALFYLICFGFGLFVCFPTCLRGTYMGTTSPIPLHLLAVYIGDWPEHWLYPELISIPKQCWRTLAVVCPTLGLVPAGPVTPMFCCLSLVSAGSCAQATDAHAPWQALFKELLWCSQVTCQGYACGNKKWFGSCFSVVQMHMTVGLLTNHRGRSTTGSFILEIRLAWTRASRDWLVFSAPMFLVSLYCTLRAHCPQCIHLLRTVSTGTDAERSIPR